MTESGIEYKAIEINEEPDGAAIQEELQRITGQRTVPNVFVAQKHVGGSDALYKFYEEGKLDGFMMKAKANTKDKEL